MTLEELSRSLPNGLHDAELHRVTIDYATRSVQLVLKAWVGRPEKREVYRPAINQSHRATLLDRRAARS